MNDDAAARLLEGLAGLRPPDTGVAPIWWLLGAALALLGVGLAVALLRRRRRTPPPPAVGTALRAESRAELDALRALLAADARAGGVPDGEAGDGARDGANPRAIAAPAAAREVLGRASVLARRLALAGAPRERVASLEGERWLAELDALCGHERFSGGVGRLLASAPYEPSPSVARAELDALLDDVAALAASVADGLEARTSRAAGTPWTPRPPRAPRPEPDRSAT